MANTIHNPGIPYVGPIPGGIYDGLQIHVSGTPEQHHNGFLISLQAGGSIDPRSECAFVFNPRFTDNQVVRNSLQGGSWGAEERHGGFPFHKGHHCDVTIHVKPHHYSVSVNGRHFCDYNHRIQKHRVTHITVEQGIRCNSIRFESHGGGRHGRHGGGIGAAIGQFAGAMFNEFNKPHQPHKQPYPGGGYPPAGAASYPSSGGAPIYNPPVPFVQGLGGLYPNKMIFISGIPHPNASRVTINLQCGHEIVAFHFDVRFSFGNDRNVIVRNTKQTNGWGPEERFLPGGYFPFQQNMYFEVIILAEPHCFKGTPMSKFMDLTHVIFTEAEVNVTFVRFTVYMQHGSHHEPQHIGMCFDARFMYGNDRNIVVRNHKQGNWGQEERHCPYFPFTPSANFEMIILVEPHCYKVAVNNQHLLEFNHRIQPLNRVDTLRIDGDLRLTQVRFQG